MKLNHINLPVPDVAATRDFFATYFGMVTFFELPKGSLTIMRDEGGLVLNLSHFGKDAPAPFPKDFHIGFFVETRAEVDAVHARMIGDGLAVAAPRKLQGRYSFYVDAPGGIATEVSVLEMG